MKNSLLNTLAIATVLVAGFSGCGGSSGSESPSGITQAQKESVLTTYANIAEKNYEDALADAQALQRAISVFVADANQTNENFTAVKNAWLRARESYGTTEIFRLSNGPIDAEDGWVAAMYGAPEGQMNAWPLDENMIDYTMDANGNGTSGNIIDTAGLFTPIGGLAVDTTTITKDVLAALNENGGDANVASGYHAIEFLLWGQDQDYSSFIADTVTNGATTAGQRDISDFISAANAQRRKDYLVAAAELLVDDLQAVSNAWQSEITDCTSGIGCYRGAFLGLLEGADAAKNVEADDALRDIFIGMGVFIKSELANERIAVAVLTPSEEDEHSCFSDNTHRDIATNYQGFVNVLKGEYKGEPQGTSFYSLLSATQQTQIDTLINSIDTKVAAIDSATANEHFDYQIKDGSSNRQNIVNAKNQMRDLGDKMVNVANEFSISLSTEDVTDPEETQI